MESTISVVLKGFGISSAKSQKTVGLRLLAVIGVGEKLGFAGVTAAG